MGDVLLSTINGDGKSKFPAFIELVLLDQIADMTKEALRHVLTSLTDRFVENNDLVNAAFSLFINTNSYITSDASIIESIYGLKRACCKQDGKLSPLDDQQRILSVVLESIAPYLIGVVDNFAARQRARSIDTLRRLLNSELQNHSHATLQQYRRLVRPVTTAVDEEPRTELSHLHSQSPSPTSTPSRRSLQVSRAPGNRTLPRNRDNTPRQRLVGPHNGFEAQVEHDVEDVEDVDGSRFTTVIFTPDGTPVRQSLAAIPPANTTSNGENSTSSGTETHSSNTTTGIARLQGRWPWLNRLRAMLLTRNNSALQPSTQQESTTTLWLRLRWISYTCLQWLMRLKFKLKFQSQAAAVVFGRLFPYLKAAYKLLVVAQRMLYLFGRTPYSHPVLAAFEIAIVKGSADVQSSPSDTDGKQNGPSSIGEGSREGSAGPNSSSSRSNSGGMSAYNWKAVAVMSALVAIRIAESLVRMDETQGGEAAPLLGLFSRLGGRGRGVGDNTPRLTRRIPPPPSAPKVAPGCVVPPRDQRLCPLCRKPRVNPCASTGGYTFCYACLIQALRENPQCPVTALPCNESDVLRIYEDAL